MLTRTIALAGVLASLMTAIAGCGEDQDTAATGTNTLTLQVSEVMDAVGSTTRAELAKTVDYGQQAPTWTFAEATLESSPATFSDVLADLPEGEFTLAVIAEPPSGSATGTAQKGIGCDMTFLMGQQEQVTIAIDGLNEFGDKGYGECAAEVTRQ